MAVRTRDFVGIAEGIKGHELSTKGKIEQLKNHISELTGRKNSLNGAISYLEAAIAAAYENTDDEGYPDYNLIASLESQMASTEGELLEVEQDIDNTSGELEHSENELEDVLEEKEQALFEIQERARKISKNIAIASGMYGAFAGVGVALQDSMKTGFSALARAAEILGGSVSGDENSGSEKSGGGSESLSSKNKLPTSNDLSMGALSAFTGGAKDGKSISFSLSATQFSSQQTERLTPGILPNFTSGSKTINIQKTQGFVSNQTGNFYAISTFNSETSLGDKKLPLHEIQKFYSKQESSGLENRLSDDSTPFSPKGALIDYMYAHNYGSDDFAIYSKDPEWQRLHQAAFPESNRGDVLNRSELAKQQLKEYMAIHNYSQGDFPEYSKDPEWQYLHQVAYPESKVVGLLVGSSLAVQHLQEYMNFHNYGIGDYPEYSKDPEWQRLHRAAYPLNNGKVLYKSGHVIKRDSHSAVENKLEERAKAFFDSIFSSRQSQGSDYDTIGEHSSRPVNQILSGYESIHTEYNSLINHQFSDLKNIEVHNLSKENLNSIISIAVENLKNRYGSRVNPMIFESIRNNISFVSDGEVKRELGKAYRIGICGYYLPEDDVIRINMDRNATVGDILATVDHEALHFMSNYTKAGEESINEAMNEGITELLSIKNMHIINPEYVSTSYRDEVEIMQALESICGTEKLLDAYMKRDTSEIESEFNYYIGNNEAFKEFCRDIDELYCYNYEKGRAVDAPIHRRDARERIYEKLNKCKVAKQKASGANIPTSIKGDKVTQMKRRQNSIGTQLKFGLNKGGLKKVPESVIGGNQVTKNEKESSFAKGLAVNLSLEEQAEFVRRRKGSMLTGSGEGAPYKEERQRSLETEIER